MITSTPTCPLPPRSTPSLKIAKEIFGSERRTASNACATVRSSLFLLPRAKLPKAAVRFTSMPNSAPGSRLSTADCTGSKAGKPKPSPTTASTKMSSIPSPAVPAKSGSAASAAASLVSVSMVQTSPLKHSPICDGLAQDNVYAVYQSRDGAVWAGTLNGGLSQLKDGHFTSYTTETGLASNTVTRHRRNLRRHHVVRNSQWPEFVFARVLARLHPATRFALSRNQLSFRRRRPRLVDWHAPTALPLSLPGKFSPSRICRRTLREQILGIAEDRGGWLWIATVNRVLRVPRDKLLDGTLGESDLREFGLTDGLTASKASNANNPWSPTPLAGFGFP